MRDLIGRSSPTSPRRRKQRSTWTSSMSSPTAVTSTAKRFSSCEEAGITVTLPKPMTSNSKADGRFGKQDFRYIAEEDVYER